MTKSGQLLLSAMWHTRRVVALLAGIAAIGVLTTACGSDDADYGPLAVVEDADGDNFAYGIVQIEPHCVQLSAGPTFLVLPVWDKDDVSWDADEAVITFANADEPAASPITIHEGDDLVVAGSEMVRQVWLATPQPGCEGTAWGVEKVWFADDEASPLNETTPTPVLSVPRPSPTARPVPQGVVLTPAPAPAGVLTETYRDDVFGLSFSYPAGWYLHGFDHIPGTTGGTAVLTNFEPNDGIGEIRPDPFKLDFYVQDNPQGLSVDGWLAERPHYSFWSAEEARVRIAGQEGIGRRQMELTGAEYLYSFPCHERMCVIAIVWAEGAQVEYVPYILDSVTLYAGAE